MNIKEILSSTVDYFNKYQIANPRLDAEVLLAHVLKKERIQLYVNFDLPLKDEELSEYRELVYKRARHLPIAYLLGEKEFMSIKLAVNQDVLIPRPETEQLVEKLVDYCQKNSLEPNVVDVGTGSGAIAVSLAYYLPAARVLAVDISPAAVEVARRNVECHELGDRVKVVEGDLLLPLINIRKNNVDIVVANLPYVDLSSMETLSFEVREEPETALYGGEDGLDYYRRLIPQARKVLREGGLLALEIGYNQGEAVKKLFEEKYWGNLQLEQDYSGQDRMVFANLL